MADGFHVEELLAGFVANACPYKDVVRNLKYKSLGKFLVARRFSRASYLISGTYVLTELFNSDLCIARVKK